MIEGVDGHTQLILSTVRPRNRSGDLHADATLAILEHLIHGVSEIPSARQKRSHLFLLLPLYIQALVVCGGRGGSCGGSGERTRRGAVVPQIGRRARVELCKVAGGARGRWTAIPHAPQALQGGESRVQGTGRDCFEWRGDSRVFVV
jgi:hypothetical protein